jgi:hypothetical protein
LLWPQQSCRACCALFSIFSRTFPYLTAAPRVLAACVRRTSRALSLRGLAMIVEVRLPTKREHEEITRQWANGFDELCHPICELRLRLSRPAARIAPTQFKILFHDSALRGTSVQVAGATRGLRHGLRNA